MLKIIESEFLPSRCICGNTLPHLDIESSVNDNLCEMSRGGVICDCGEKYTYNYKRNGMIKNENNT